MARSSIYTGGGRLYFKKKNSDSSTDPLMYFGKTDGITMSTSIEWQEHYDTEACESLLDARYPTSKNTTINFETSEVTLEMFNRAMLGEIVEIEQTSATDVVVVVDPTEVKVGYIIDTGYVNATGCTIDTYVEGTDFSFDSKAGYITIIEGGGIADGATLTIALATVPAQTRRISAAMKTSALLGEFIVVTSSQTGNNFKYTFKNISVTMDGDFSIKGSEISTLTFVGSVMIDTTTQSGSLSDFVDIEELISEEC